MGISWIEEALMNLIWLSILVYVLWLISLVLAGLFILMTLVMYFMRVRVSKTFLIAGVIFAVIYILMSLFVFKTFWPF